MTPPSGCVPSSPPWRLSVSRWQRPTLAGSAEPRPLAPRGVGSGRSWRGWLTEQGLFDQVSPKREDHTTVTVRQLSAAPQPCLGATAAKVLLGSAMLGAALVTEGFQPSIGCAGVPGTGQRALLGRHRARAGHGSRHRRLELTLHWIRRIGRYVEMQRAGGHHRGTGGYHRARGYHRADSGELATLDATAADRPKGHAAIAGRCLRPRVFEHARSTCGDGSDGSDGATMIEATQQRHVPHVLDGWR